MVATSQSTIVKEDLLFGARSEEAGYHHLLEQPRFQLHLENLPSEQQAQQRRPFLRGRVGRDVATTASAPTNGDGGAVINYHQYRRHLVKLATGQEEDFNHTKWQLIWIGGLCVGCAWMLILIVKDYCLVKPEARVEKQQRLSERQARLNEERKQRRERRQMKKQQRKEKQSGRRKGGGSQEKQEQPKKSQAALAAEKEKIMRGIFENRNSDVDPPSSTKSSLATGGGAPRSQRSNSIDESSPKKPRSEIIGGSPNGKNLKLSGYLGRNPPENRGIGRNLSGDLGRKPPETRGVARHKSNDDTLLFGSSSGLGGGGRPPLPKRNKSNDVEEVAKSGRQAPEERGVKQSRSMPVDRGVGRSKSNDSLPPRSPRSRSPSTDRPVRPRSGSPSTDRPVRPRSGSPSTNRPKKSRSMDTSRGSKSNDDSMPAQKRPSQAAAAALLQIQ